MRAMWLNRPLAAILGLAGIAFVIGAGYGFFHVPPKQILTCERRMSFVIACEPGALTASKATVQKTTGRGAKECLVLGDEWVCGGNVDRAAETLNELLPGARAEIDLTPLPPSPAALAVPAILGILMVAIAARDLLRSFSDRSPKR